MSLFNTFIDYSSYLTPPKHLLSTLATQCTMRRSHENKRPRGFRRGVDFRNPISTA